MTIINELSLEFKFEKLRFCIREKGVIPELINRRTKTFKSWLWSMTLDSFVSLTPLIFYRSHSVIGQKRNRLQMVLRESQWLGVTEGFRPITGDDKPRLFEGKVWNKTTVPPVVRRTIKFLVKGKGSRLIMNNITKTWVSLAVYNVNVLNFVKLDISPFW